MSYEKEFQHEPVIFLLGGRIQDTITNDNKRKTQILPSGMALTVEQQDFPVFLADLQSVLT